MNSVSHASKGDNSDEKLLYNVMLEHVLVPTLLSTSAVFRFKSGDKESKYSETPDGEEETLVE